MMDDETILLLAKKYFETHKNPIRKFELPGIKLNILKHIDDEKALLQSGLDSIKSLLEQERVERRCARVVAYWLPNEKLVRLDKGGKILNTYGFVNKNGRFLFPEEALTLLELNRIELMLDKVPMSIQTAYNMLIITDFELNKYLAYRKLSIQGFRLVRSVEQIKSCKQIGSPPAKKCRLEHLPLEKLPCFESIAGVSSDKDDSQELSCKDHSVKLVKEMFIKLQENSPKRHLFTSEVEESDYKLFFPENTNKGENDFNLIFSIDKYFDPRLGFLNTKNPTVVNFRSSEFSGYFQVAHVTIPSLL